MMHHFISVDTMILPNGCTPEDDPYEYSPYTLHVRWQGPSKDGTGSWSITNDTQSRHLSKQGNWDFSIRNPADPLYRWKSYEEAIMMAESHVDSITVAGKTYAQYQQWLADNHK